MALTERQQQIQDLLEQGKSAKEIAEALGITTNGVYQQLRRMRAGGASAKPAKRAKTKPAKTAPTKSAPAKSPGVNESTAPPRVMTPLQAIRARRDDLAAGLREAEAAVVEAGKALDKAVQTRDKIAERITPELESLDRAERAIRGEAEPTPEDVTQQPVPVPDPPVEQPKVDEAKPAAEEQPPAKPSNAKAKPKAKPAQAPPAKTAAQTPTPATQGEREATADPFEDGADDAAKAEAEAAQAAAEAQAA